MGRALFCPQGNQWEVSEEQISAASSLCPVCGAESQQETIAGYDLEVPLPIPTLTDFEILEELGRGGMGVVYRARHLGLEREVALKIIRKDRMTHGEIVSRFRREAQAAARLSHPNIVQVLASDQENGLDYLAMEYVPGVTVESFVKENGAVSLNQACDYLRQAARGLQHAHERGLIHRDIKPANLMLTGPEASPHRVVKILDMGVARLRQLKNMQDETLTTLTQHGAILGTPDYIAPEQLENPSEVDIRADLYSLGCTAYYLLTGQVPFPGGSMIQKLDRQRWEIPPAVNQIRSDLPSSIASLVRRLMAKSPDDRYQEPAEVVGGLEELERTGYVSLSTPNQSIAPSHQWKAHEGSVSCARFLPRAKLLVSGGSDRRLRWWDREQQQVRESSFPQEVSEITVAPGEKQILVATGATLRLFDVKTGKELRRFVGHLDAIRSVCFSSDGKTILSGGDDRVARLWDVQRGKVYERLNGHRNGINSLAMSPDGAWVISGSRDQTMRLWNVRKGREKQKFKVPRGNVFAVGFTPDGRQVISAHFDTSIRFWDVQDGRETRLFRGHRRIVSSFDCSPDGASLISGGHDATIRWWDCASGIEQLIGEGHQAAITCVSASSEGDLIASGDVEGNLCLWRSQHNSGRSS